MRAILIFTLLFSFAGMTVHAQTNDPRLSQQYYIGAHNIDQLWNTTTGSSGTRIAIHSATGFTSSHEDMAGSRYLNPFTNWFAPNKGFASELAGIVGANSNNGIGIAGINWNATLRSYNFVEVNFSNPEPNLVFNADNANYYFNTEYMSHMLDQANTDNMDVHLFTFGVPTSSRGKLQAYDATNPSLSDYKLLYEGPSFPLSPQEQYQKDFQNALISMGTNIWNALKNNDFQPANPNIVFRHKLWDAAENQNRILVAPVGDAVDGRNTAPVLMPFSFDDFVIGVGGGELTPSEERIHWDGAGISPYVNVTAAAKDIVSVSGEDYDAYNEEFNSTQASAAIVAGVASLLKTQLPNYRYEDIRHVLQNTAIDIEDPGVDNKTGHGWLDAQAAIDYIQNNDFVRKSVPKSEILTNYMNEIEQVFELDEQYKVYGDPNTKHLVVGVQGKINEFRGRIYFDYAFSSVPDIWLLNSSSGTDISPINDYQNFEQYEKSLEITHIDRFGFNFEMKYWNITTYRSGGTPNETFTYPNLPDIVINYTAVGDETNDPALPPSAPTNLVVTNLGQGGAFSAPQLSWDDNTETNFDHYRVFRRIIDIDIGHQEIASVSSSAFTDWEINQVQTGGNDITYFVRAVNTNNQQSANSNIVMVHGESTINLRLADDPGLPVEFLLKSNYPNPFNPTSVIRFELPEPSSVKLDVYDMIGRRVAVLVDRDMQPGRHEAVFDAASLSSGNYIARFSAVAASGERFVQTLNMQLIK